MFSTIRGLATVGVVATLCVTANAQMSQQNQNLVGWSDLKVRLEAAVPTGQALAVGQVEGKKDQYGPNPSNSDFNGKDMVAMSGNPGSSTHATTVGKHFYGLYSSMSHAVPLIYLWYPMDWLTAHLNATIVGSIPPLPPPDGLVVINHSWASTYNIGFDNNVLRRADWLMREYGVLMVAGTVNPPKAFQPLMAGTYNGISVGLANGNHTPGPVGSLHDGAGRSKPEIVGPSNLTSYATPIVSAAVNLLFETAETLPRIAGTPEARLPEVIKAALLAGATHRSGWSNNAPVAGPLRGETATPLDPHYGVDLVNVDRAHWILGGGIQPGASDPQGAPIVARTGWDHATVFSGSSRWYRLHVPMEADFVSVLATWNRTVNASFTGFWVADFDLHLWRVEGDGLMPLVGDAGLPWFDSGNVVSRGEVDNIEHLYIRGLQPGEYMIELRRMDDGPAAEVTLAWYRQTDAMPGDVNENGVIGGFDLGTVLRHWGTTANVADVNGDGKVDGVDLAKLLQSWFLMW